MTRFSEEAAKAEHQAAWNDAAREWHANGVIPKGTIIIGPHAPHSPLAMVMISNGDGTVDCKIGFCQPADDRPKRQYRRAKPLK